MDIPHFIYLFNNWWAFSLFGAIVNNVAMNLFHFSWVGTQEWRCGQMILWCLTFRGNSRVAAKSLQSCLTLCDPIDGSPPGSPIPGILQARTLEWVAISFSNAWKWKVKVKLLSRILLLVTPWTAAYQAPPSIGFSRQEYWSGVPLPSLITCLPFLKKLYSESWERWLQMKNWRNRNCNMKGSPGII